MICMVGEVVENLCLEVRKTRRGDGMVVVVGLCCDCLLGWWSCLIADRDFGERAVTCVLVGCWQQA